MMQNYMSQLVQNPRLLENVLNAPYMQPLMDSLAANPDISRQMVMNNPMFANNPDMRDQMLNALPAMMEQMRNPEVQALMQNREALEAITQVQEGLKDFYQTKVIHYFIFRTSTITYSCTESFSSVRIFHSIENKQLFSYSSGGLPAGLRFGPTGLTAPGNIGAPGSSTTQPPPSSQPTGPSQTAPSNDSNNYAGVFAQMLNMMSNQNIVCQINLSSYLF
jgi:hypothetical protein